MYDNLRPHRFITSPYPNGTYLVCNLQKLIKQLLSLKVSELKTLHDEFDSYFGEIDSVNMPHTEWPGDPIFYLRNIDNTHPTYSSVSIFFHDDTNSIVIRDLGTFRKARRLLKDCCEFIVVHMHEFAIRIDKLILSHPEINSEVISILDIVIDIVNNMQRFHGYHIDLNRNYNDHPSMISEYDARPRNFINMRSKNT